MSWHEIDGHDNFASSFFEDFEFEILFNFC